MPGFNPQPGQFLSLLQVYGPWVTNPDHNLGLQQFALLAISLAFVLLSTSQCALLCLPSLFSLKLYVKNHPLS